jgi:nitrile hydratase beta subunit
MSGVHDMGGMHGMGPIQREKNEPVFHARWESRVYVMNRALALWGKGTIDASRQVKEVMPPIDYFRMSYYERTYGGIIELLVKTGLLLVKTGLVTREEVNSGKPAKGSAKATPPLTGAQVPAWFAKAVPKKQGPPVSARFEAGHRVRARNIHPEGHTRLVRYARGKQGIVERDHGVFPFPDRVAHFLPDKPQHLYSVRFAARELWGEQAKPQDAVYLDLWDDYLEPV